jgi:Rap1a immunity proteins
MHATDFSSTDSNSKSTSDFCGLLSILERLESRAFVYARTFAKLSAFFFLPTFANAGLMTGNDLLKYMNESTKFDEVAIGYTSGVSDMLTASKALCLPETVTGGQIYEIARQFLKDNPKKRHESAAWLVAESLKDAGFICRNK